MEIELKRFDPASVPDSAICLFIGRRGSGKSTALKDVLYHKRQIPSGVVFSSTEESNNFFSGCVPSTFIFSEYRGDVLERLIKRQRNARRQGQSHQSCFLVADDCMYDKQTIRRDPNVRMTFMNGRHYGILLLMTMQYSLDIDPALRLNADYVFVFRDPVLKNKERLYENFFGMFPSFHVFCRVFDQCTENYECLVLDNRSTSNRIEDCVFWYKARDRGSFRVGCPEFWTYHAINYDPDAADEGSAARDTAVAVRRGDRVVVKKRI